MSPLFTKRFLVGAMMAAALLLIHSPLAQAQHRHDPPAAPPATQPSPTSTPTATPDPMKGMDMPASPQTTPTPTATPDPMKILHPPGLTHISDDHDSLTVMRGDEMLLRVGRGRDNFISMNQNGSGTSWLPATSPMYMWQQIKGPWLLMYHAEMKLGANYQNGPRGVTKFESQNWFMPMAIRQAGPGTLQLKAMISLEPFTFSPGGSPQLFQTGETYQNRPLRDKQHPHDLFMTLSAAYTVPIGDRATWFGYIGMPGEPALGPTAFMHRPSAAENPSAPLSHHLQDATHISFGVATTGFTYRWFQVEGSVFNGREPDENRYNFEFHPWSSRSFRISVAPSKNWSAQWSYGWLHEPEAEEPGNIRRMTASVSYNQKIAGGTWATSLIWGRNLIQSNSSIILNSYLAETTVNFKDLNYVYSRLELTDKNHLLERSEEAQIGIPAGRHPIFRIAAFTIGAARDIFTTDKIRVAIGGDATLYRAPAILNPIYGDRPAGFHFYLRFRPGRMTGESHGSN